MWQLGHDMNEAREGRRKLCNTARTGVLRRGAGKAVEVYSQL